MWAEQSARMGLLIWRDHKDVVSQSTFWQPGQDLRGDGVGPQWQDRLLFRISPLWDFLLLAVRLLWLACPPCSESCEILGAVSWWLIHRLWASKRNVSPQGFNHLSFIQAKFWVLCKKFLLTLRNIRMGCHLYLNATQEGLMDTNINFVFFPKNVVEIYLKTLICTSALCLCTYVSPEWIPQMDVYEEKYLLVLNVFSLLV